MVGIGPKPLDGSKDYNCEPVAVPPYNLSITYTRQIIDIVRVIPGGCVDITLHLRSETHDVEDVEEYWGVVLHPCHAL